MYQCSPAQHKSSPGGSPQTTTDTPSNTSRSPQKDGLTCMNNGSNGKESVANDITAVEGCVQAAREYLKLAQSHVQEFTRFVEAWESSQKQFSESQSPDTAVTISETRSFTMPGGSPQISKSSSTNADDIFAFDSNTNQTQEIHKFLSDLGTNTYIYKDQELVPPTSMNSTGRAKTTLAPKDSNRPLRPKSDPIEKTAPRMPKRNSPRPAIRGWRPSLRGENEPWVACAPLDASELPQQTRTSSLPEGTFIQRKFQSKTSGQTLSTGYSPSTLSKSSNHSSFTIEETFPRSGGADPPSMLVPIESISFGHKSSTQCAGQPSEGFQLQALNENFDLYGNAMGSGFNFALCFDQELPQDLDDPFVSSFMTGHSSFIASEPLFVEAPSEYVPTAREATREHPQAQGSISNMHIDSFLKDICLQTPPQSIVPSLDIAPWSITSQDMALLTPQGAQYTPTRRVSGRLMGSSMFEGQNKELDIDWSSEDTN